MSLIVVTPDNYATVRRTMNELYAQTARKQLEVVLVVPSVDQLAPDDTVLAGFANVQIVPVGLMQSAAQARAAGVRAATAPVVAMTEDHSFYEPTWAEALIRAHRQPWAAAGPAVANANPRSLASWANLLIEYSEWLVPASGGWATHLPGNKCSYKRDILLRYGDELGAWLESETLLHWDLRAKGNQLYLEPTAQVKHLNFSHGVDSIFLRFHGGRSFAAKCCRHWSPMRRLLYSAGAPLIPFVRSFRILRELCRPGRNAERFLLLLPVLLFLLICDAAGEMIGYTFGAGDAARRLIDLDFHRERFMNEQDRREFANRPGT